MSSSAERNMKKIAWQIAQQITGRSFSKEYNELKKEPEHGSYLAKLLRHAHDNVPYYGEPISPRIARAGWGGVRIL